MKTVKGRLMFIFAASLLFWSAQKIVVFISSFIVALYFS